MITDIDNCLYVISSIIDVKILNRPKKGLVGLKWIEKREVFGKEASETMWITDSEKNSYYSTRAESNGSIYITKLSLNEVDGKTILTMVFTGEAQTFISQVMLGFFGIFIKKSMKKDLLKDLTDIKRYVEKS